MKFGKKWGMANRLRRLKGPVITCIYSTERVAYNSNAIVIEKEKKDTFECSGFLGSLQSEFEFECEEKSV